MKYLVFGATGLVGSSLVQKLSIDHSVTVAVRNLSQIKNKKISKQEVDFKNFDKFDSVKYDGVYCCLGTTKKNAGSKEAFKRVDFNYVQMCYEYAVSVEAKFFCVISALGANKDSPFFYNKIKGNMEESLTGPVRVIIVRPSLLIGKRKEFRPAEKISEVITKPFSKLLTNIIGKYAPIKASDVAQAMIDLSVSGSTPIKIEYFIKSF